MPRCAPHESSEERGVPLSELAAEPRENGVELNLAAEVEALPRTPDRLRVVIDSSVLLGNQRRYVAAAIHLGYVDGYWSTWIVAELVRKRTEWITRRAVREQCDIAETMRRLEKSRQRVNLLIEELSRDIRSVDYHNAPDADLSWLTERDPDDVPVMETALAAQATILITEDRRAYPLGEERNGVKIMSVQGFLVWLYQSYSEAEQHIQDYLKEQGSSK